MTGLAELLGVHLGVPEMTIKELKDAPNTEKIFLFQEYHTKDWHERRHQFAQVFTALINYV